MPSTLNGASSKPALTTAPSGALVLAWNVQTRVRMALSTSTNGGMTWAYLATLDNGTDPGAPAGEVERTDAYPTVIVTAGEILTAWSTYNGGPAIDVPPSPANIKLARVPLDHGMRELG